MKHNRNFLLILLVLGILLSLIQASRLLADKQISEQLVQDIVEKARRSTVFLETYDRNRKKGKGSGFFIAPNLIASSIHVVAGAKEVKAKLVKAKTLYTIEGVTAFNPKNDLVILKIAEEGVALPIGDSTAVVPRQQIITVGNPKGEDGKIAEEGKVTVGTIHSIRDSDKILRLKVKLASGNSGGPVLNNKGEVIGIVSKAGTSSSYAIPSKTFKELLSYTKVQPLSDWNDIPQIRAYVYLVQAQTKYQAVQDFLREEGEGQASAVLIEVLEAAEDELVEVIKLYKFAGAYELLGDVSRKQAAAHKLLGNVSKEREQYQKAIDAYTKALEFIPDSAHVYVLRAQIRRKHGNIGAGDYEKAIDDFTKAIKFTPKEYSEDYYEGRAGIYFRLGRTINNEDLIEFKLGYYKKALNDFTQVIEIDRGNNTVQDFTNRGVVYHAIGEATYETVYYQDYYEKALSDFREALKLEDNAQKQERLRKDIDSIKGFLEKPD